MKRIISILVILTLCLALFAGCSLLPEEITLREVNFYVDGELYLSEDVVLGQSVATPKNPEKENHVFIGWRTEGDPAYMYDFSFKVMNSINLHACFTLDTVAVGNMIAEKILKSTVQVFNTATNTGGEEISEMSMSQGSGVVIKIASGCCYVLTNAHVVDKIEGYSNHKLTVRDPWGYSYDAEIYIDQSTKIAAISEDYDLAVIRFRYSPNPDQQLGIINLGDDAKIGDYVVAVGSPEGLMNAVTYGKALVYQRINASKDDPIDKIPFEVLYYNAPTNHGSSGGALVDAYGKLVGISFAGVEDGEYGCAIPVSKVKEFLSVFYKQYK